MWYCTPALAKKRTRLARLPGAMSSLSPSRMRPAMVAPEYTAITVSISLPVLSKTVSPDAGAVHLSHTERLATLPGKWLGSPDSAVAPELVVPMVLALAGRNWANWKLSYAGAADAGDAVA